jgi:hypothetical protein
MNAWHDFWSVVYDLGLFLVDGARIFVAPRTTTESIHLNPLPLPSPPNVLQIESPQFLKSVEATSPDEVGVPTLLKPTTQSVAQEVLAKSVMMYVSQIAGTPCFNLPQQDFDCVIDTLQYGAAVTVIGYMGQYACVNRSNMHGWVRKDDITSDKSSIWPSYIVSTVYDAYHTDTIKSRRLIADQFYAGALHLPLQANEYITLKLLSENRALPWTHIRPRVAGQWKHILRGLKGIHIGVVPKIDSIMEWSTEDGEGRLAYVESVTKDNTIIFSTIGIDSPGLYVSKTSTEDEWKECRPVFIEVT